MRRARRVSRAVRNHTSAVPGRPVLPEFAMATAVTLNEVAGPTLKQRLARAERMNRLKSQALILPLLLFLVLTFLVPIVALLFKSVNNPEVVGSMPLTVQAISSWDGKSLPPDAAYKALAEDLAAARKNQT